MKGKIKSMRGKHVKKCDHIGRWPCDVMNNTIAAEDLSTKKWITEPSPRGQKRL